jgi:lysozyme
MKTGPRGLGLIKSFEGLRLDAYTDAVGVWTIGYGHTAAAGAPRPRAGLKITKEEADAILAGDLTKYESAVSRVVSRQPNQNQFDAMVSLCFNVGPRNFSGSRLVKLFNAGDDEGAANAFLAWRKADGKVLSGLERRREAERRLFLSQSRTTPGKWAVAGAGGTMGGTIAVGAADSFASSFGYSLSSFLDWRGLLVIGVIIGIIAIMGLLAMGEERRERLWDGIVGL